LAIDGRHRYLIPGLVDSHVHLPLTGATDQFLVLRLLLANGITTGINMEGSPEILALRNQIEQGAILVSPENLHHRSIHSAADIHSGGSGQKRGYF
jgi:N-acyl-D-aspartate/D-glutamate deacylase